MSKASILSIFLSLLWLNACNHDPDLGKFTYTYSMESINNFRVDFQLNPDSTWQIGRYNFFFDRFDDKQAPQLLNGKLTEEEYNRFSKLISDSRLGEMGDSYGFDKEEVIGNDIVIMFSLIRGDESKFVSIREDSEEQFTKGFRALISFTGQFLDEKLADE